MSLIAAYTPDACNLDENEAEYSKLTSNVLDKCSWPDIFNLLGDFSVVNNCNRASYMISVRIARS